MGDREPPPTCEACGAPVTPGTPLCAACNRKADESEEKRNR